MRALHVGGALCLALFAFAFIAAPHSCEWGLSAYFWSGLACLAALFLLPFALREPGPVSRRVGLGALWLSLGGITWVAGLFAANVRILCRLF